MLTKTDLAQIKKVVKTEFKGSVTKSDLRKELNPIRSDITKIRKDIDVIISLFDREYLEIRARVERIEQHLNLEPISP